MAARGAAALPGEGAGGPGQPRARTRNADRASPLHPGRRPPRRGAHRIHGARLAAPREGACGFCEFQAVCGPLEERRFKLKPKDDEIDAEVERLSGSSGGRAEQMRRLFGSVAWRGGASP